MADRQDRLPKFSTAALASARVLLIGGGGFGGHIACGLVRKGAGDITIVDGDTVEPSNLNRQPFQATDVGRPKALALAKYAARCGFLGSCCVGHHVAFDCETAPLLLSGKTLALCCVDNDATRHVASLACRARQIPCIHMACNEAADFCWLFVEEPGPKKACVGGVFPRIAAADPERQFCQAVPAVLDILLIAAGMALYCVDSLVMSRQRGWNYRDMHLIAGAAESFVTVRPGCPLCQPKRGRP